MADIKIQTGISIKQTVKDQADRYIDGLRDDPFQEPPSFSKLVEKALEFYLAHVPKIEKTPVV